jgi:hypothetical protein
MALTADHPVRASALSAGQVWDRIFDGLGAAMLPTVLKDALDNAETPAELVLAPTGALAVVPVSALSITPGVPLMDVAQVSYLPSIALLSQRRRRTLHEVVDRLDSPPRQLTPVLAVLAPRWAPDDENQDLPHAVSGAPQDSERVTGPLVKRDLVNLLAHPHSSERILYLAGHVKGPATSDPGAMGFEFSDGSLTLHDFYRNDSTGAPLYRLPRRIILAACSSLGLHGDAESGYAPSLVDAPEWLGMGAAVIHSGAQQVYCTLFKIPDSEHATRIGNALADALQRDLDPPAALRAVQRAELRRWKDSDGSLPLVFLAYAYVGLGQGRGKELLSPPDDVPVPVQVPAREPMQVPAPEPVKVAAVTPQPRPHETSEKPFMMMSRHGPGEEKFADLRNPRFLPDSRLRRSTFDGEVAGPVVLRAARYNTEPFHALNTCEWRFMRSRLFLTDARLVVLVDKRDRQGRRFAGHIRYPWISAVGFRPQQGILDECELLIEIHQDDVGPRRLTLLLQKDTDSGELAQQLVRRIAGHHLDHGELPDAVVPSFEALRDAPRLLAPIKGQHATYWLDAYKSFPYGTEYVLDRPVEGTWIGPGVGRSG